MGNIACLIMVGVMYVFGAILFKKRKYAIGASLLVCLDTFFFVISRIGTVDIFLVLFITLANMFMVLFNKKQKTKYLFWSGLFFGLSVSIKWIGLYGGLTLAIIYFYTLFKKKIFNYKYILKGFLFFVFIPLFLYVFWFYLFPNNLYKTNNIDNIIKENQEMFEYHSKLTEGHFFSSEWYTWPISYKPVWLYQQFIDETNKETISLFGNLVIWYTGIVAFCYSIYLYFKKKDINILFVIISALALWIPFAFISRAMFLYHYLSVLPFLYLLIIYMIKDLEKRFKKNIILPIFLVCCLLFFIIYFPIASGTPVSDDYAKKLQLFDSWYF
jgi:dolichyl-phosphate-mannose--protein O-mannosyl transferase